MTAADNPPTLATEVVIAAVTPFVHMHHPASNGDLGALILARAAKRMGILRQLESACRFLLTPPGEVTDPERAP